MRAFITGLGGPALTPAERQFLNEAEIAGLGIAPKARAQELSVAQFVALANHAHRHSAGGV